MADRVSQRGKRKTVQFRGMFVWTLYSTFIFLPIYAFYYKRFSKTNSTDPRQHVPLMMVADTRAANRLVYRPLVDQSVCASDARPHHHCWSTGRTRFYTQRRGKIVVFLLYYVN